MNGMLLLAANGTDVFTKVSSMATDLYKSFLTIGGPIAIVSVAIALIVSMCSHNQKAVDASKQVIKWIVVAFFALFILGSVFTWVADKVGMDGTDFKSPTAMIENQTPNDNSEQFTQMLNDNNAIIEQMPG